MLSTSKRVACTLLLVALITGVAAFGYSNRPAAQSAEGHDRPVENRDKPIGNEGLSGKIENSSSPLVNPTREDLENFLGQNKVDENEYRVFSPREKILLAEKVGVLVFYTSGEREAGKIYEMMSALSALPAGERLPHAERLNVSLYQADNLMEAESIERRVSKAPVVVIGSERTVNRIREGRKVSDGFVIAIDPGKPPVTVSFPRGSEVGEIFENARYICVDFARDLQRYAHKSGFRSAYVSLGFSDAPTGHALNAFKLADGPLVFVEPQSDRVIGSLEPGDPYTIGFDSLTVEVVRLTWETKK